MNNQKKKLYSDKWSKSNTRDIFNEKQKIAIEKYEMCIRDRKGSKKNNRNELWKGNILQ